MKRIRRKDYLDWLIKWKEHQIIKVVTGVRRCGKSINVNIKMYIFDHLRMYIFAIPPLDRYIFSIDKIFQ